jgi:murein DD-endopeptidase MepM/ murein hydrolase activator NlpD
MPIIVPIEDNKVGLATATDAKFRAPDYSGSGLEALGAGLAQLGGGGQQLASGLEERRRRAAEAIAAAMLDDRHQSNIDDAAVKQAYVDYSDPTHEALHGEGGLFNRQGAGAHAAFPGLVETLVDNHDKALSKLDDVQRAAIAPAMNERLRNDVARAADYVRQQGAAEQKWQSEQLQKAAARDAVNQANDPDLFDHHLATGEKAIRQQAKIDKVGDELLAKQIADYKSGVHADTIETLTQRDPAHAAGWYARNGDTLNRRDKLRVEAKLAPALADARAVADVDAASGMSDPTSAPANPHPGNNALLLLKMQGITPMMDQTELPSLMQRYGNDPAKAWAAFEAGPDTIDRLIAQRGDDWYRGLGDDTRRFVAGNVAMLGTAKSLRAEPSDTVAADMRLDPVTRRALPGDFGAVLESQAGADIHPKPADAPRVGLQPAVFHLPAATDGEGGDNAGSGTVDWVDESDVGIDDLLPNPADAPSDDTSHRVDAMVRDIEANFGRQKTPPRVVNVNGLIERRSPLGRPFAMAIGRNERGPNGKPYSDGRYDPTGGHRWRSGRAHYGDDMKGSIGDPVYAAAAGMVLMVSTFRVPIVDKRTGKQLIDVHGKPESRIDGWGHYIAIQSPDGYVQIYGHLKPSVLAKFKAGQRVGVGDRLGEIGNSGNAETRGDHLHFEVRRSNGRATLAKGGRYRDATVDPQAWLAGKLPNVPLTRLSDAPILEPNVARRRARKK